MTSRRQICEMSQIIDVRAEQENARDQILAESAKTVDQLGYSSAQATWGLLDGKPRFIRGGPGSFLSEKAAGTDSNTFQNLLKGGPASTDFVSVKRSVALIS